MQEVAQPSDEEQNHGSTERSLEIVEQEKPNVRELFLGLLDEVKKQTRERYLQRLKNYHNLPSTDENQPLTFEELFENNEDMMSQMRQRVDAICQQMIDEIAELSDAELVRQFITERQTKAAPDPSFEGWLKNSMTRVLSEMPKAEAEAAGKMRVAVLNEQANTLLSLKNLELLPWVLALEDEKIVDLGENKIGGTIRNKSDLAEIFERALDQGKQLPVAEKPTQSRLGNRLGKMLRGRSAASGQTESNVASENSGEVEPNSYDLAVQIADKLIAELIRTDVASDFSTQLAETFDTLIRKNRPDIIQAEQAMADEEAMREFFGPAEKYGSLELNDAQDCDPLYNEIIGGLQHPLKATYTTTRIPYYSITLWGAEFVRILVPPFLPTSQDKRLTLVFTSSDVSTESISSFGAPVLANIIKSHVTGAGSAQ
ncbi:hypothetical protein KBC89_02145 [Candidatus Woesebacteria bacterium]|nr:hypothetical protein [Candidatus Woesebacteria bacterium]